MQQTVVSSKLSSLAFVCSLVFIIDVFLIHFLKSDLSWLSNTLSEYAIGERGYIINIGFYCIAAAQLIIAYLVNSDKHTDSILGPVLLALAGFGALLVAVFPVQPPTAEFIDRLPHMAGAIMQFLFFPLALLAGGHSLQTHRLYKYTHFTARVTLLFFVILLVLFLLRSRFEFAYFGLLEKIDIVLITLWLLIYSFYSMRSR